MNTKRKTKRRTIKEAYLHGYVCGFEDCLIQIENKMREEFFSGSKSQADYIWAIIEPLQKKLSDADKRYKQMYSDRLGLGWEL